MTSPSRNLCKYNHFVYVILFPFALAMLLLPVCLLVYPFFYTEAVAIFLFISCSCKQVHCFCFNSFYHFDVKRWNTISIFVTVDFKFQFFRPRIPSSNSPTNFPLKTTMIAACPKYRLRQNWTALSIGVTSLILCPN